MFLPSKHRRCNLTGCLREVTADCEASDTLLHTWLTETVFTLILSGLPPISSKRTRRLSEGFRKDRGIWYLNSSAFDYQCIARNWELKQNTKFIVEVYIYIYTYRDWEGSPVGVRKETQYRPMLSPLMYASPLPMLDRSRATGSSPRGASNVVCTISRISF